MRSGFLTKTEEARTRGSAQEAEAALDAALLFIRGHECLIREDARVQDIGRDDEARVAPHFLLELRLLDADRCLDVPLHGGSRICAGTPTTRVMLSTDALALHLQPDRQSFQSSGRKNSGTSPSCVVASASIHCAEVLSRIARVARRVMAITLASLSADSSPA
jgi:hypothetical protein